MSLLNDIGKAVTFVKALNGDSFAKGDSFERKVSTMFPDSDFSCVHVTTGRGDLDGRKIEDSLKPDYQFRHRETDHLFWVECKYRSQAENNMVTWTTPEQLNRYRRFQSAVRPQKVYVAIGLGGLPNFPKQVFCIPLDDAKYPSLYLSVLEKYQHDPRRPFEYVGYRVR